MGAVKFDAKGDMKDPSYDINEWREGKYAADRAVTREPAPREPAPRLAQDRGLHDIGRSAAAPRRFQSLRSPKADASARRMSDG